MPAERQEVLQGFGCVRYGWIQQKQHTHTAFVFWLKAYEINDNTHEQIIKNTNIQNVSIYLNVFFARQ